MAPKWVIRLLGPFEIERDGQPLPETVWHTQQAKQALKILILARGRPVPAERLMEWLWPGANPETTATTLRSTIHALRRVLEPDRAPREPSRYVVTRSPGYAFEPDENVWVDVYAFEQLLAQAARVRHAGHKRRLLTQALELYRGDLLEEDPYAEWALLERERLREQYLDALLELAELHAQAGDVQRAIAACRRVLARDEYREAAYRALMRYHVMAGDVAAALSTYERCRRMLKEEFGAEPAPQTQMLYEAILRGEVTPPPRLPEWSPSHAEPRGPLFRLPPYSLPFDHLFVGRQEARERLNRRVEGVWNGSGGLVAVTGEMGMGKTHLVLHVLRQWEKRVDLVGTRCLVIEQDLPFAPLIQVLRQMADGMPPERWQAVSPYAVAHVALLVPALYYHVPDLPPVPRTTPEEDRMRLIEALANVFVALSDQHPLVLFFDDIHWADEGTLAVLGRLAYRSTRHPLLLVVTYASEMVGENLDLQTLLAQLRHDGIVEEIPLHPLDEHEVAEFLARVWNCAPHDVADLAAHVHAMTEGVPLYLVEVIREVRSRTEARPRPSDLPAVQSLHPIRSLIRERMGRLPREARDVLQLAAVIGRSFPVEVLETAAPFDPLPAVEILLRQRFLQEEARGQLSFVHDVVRQVIYASLSGLARKRWHRQVAEALVALYGDEGPHVVQVARHYREAGAQSRLTALRYTVLAADYLRRTYGFRQACDHYHRALQLANGLLVDDAVYHWVRRAYEGLGLAYEAMGDWEGIASTYRGLRQWAEEQGDATLALFAAQRLVAALVAVGRLSDAAALAGEVVAAYSEPNSPVAEVFQRLHIVFAGESPSSGAPDEQWPAFIPPKPVAGKPWEELTHVLGGELAPLPLSLYGWSLALQGQLDAADACLAHAAALAERQKQVPYAVLAYHFAAHVAFLKGDSAAMEERLDLGFRRARQVPNAEWSTWWARVFEGYVLLHQGNVAAARERFRAVERALAGQTAFRSHRLSAWVGLALVAVREHRIAEAQARLDHVLAEWAMLDAVTGFWAHIAAAAIARHGERWEEAARHVRAALAFAGRRGLPFEYVAAVGEAVRLFTLWGKADQLEPLLRSLGQVLKTVPIPAVRSMLDRIYRWLPPGALDLGTRPEPLQNAGPV